MTQTAITPTVATAANAPTRNRLACWDLAAHAIDSLRHALSGSTPPGARKDPDPDDRQAAGRAEPRGADRCGRPLARRHSWRHPRPARGAPDHCKTPPAAGPMAQGALGR